MPREGTETAVPGVDIGNAIKMHPMPREGTETGTFASRTIFAA